MEIFSYALLYTHMVAGFGSIILFWIPVFARKGGINHRKIGKLYVRLMWGVVVTALLLSVINLVNQRVVMAAFLSFLALLTGRPLWHGTAILSNKRGVSKLFQRIHVMSNVMLVSAGLALVLYGISLDGKGPVVPMYVFGGLGMSAVFELVKSVRSSDVKVDWFREHLSDMCVSGIAAYTAFFAFGASRYIEGLLTGVWTVVPWLAPTVVGTVGIRLTVRYYRKLGRIAV